MNTQDTAQTIDRLIGEADTTISHAARHLADKSLSDLGKKERIDSELGATRDRLEGRLADIEADFTTQRGRAGALINAIPVPSQEEFNALAYTRDVLRSRFKGQKSGEIFQGFQAALEGTDNTLIRAYMLEAPRVSKPSDAKDLTPGMILSLVSKAEEKLRTPEQKAAANVLSWLDSDGKHKLAQLRFAIARLKTAKPQGGQLVTNESGYKSVSW